MQKPTLRKDHQVLSLFWYEHLIASCLFELYPLRNLTEPLKDAF